MAQLGRMEARLTLAEPMAVVPEEFAALPLSLEEDGRVLVYRGGDGQGQGRRQVAELAQGLAHRNIVLAGIETRQSSLEDIFVNLVERNEAHQSEIEA
jgi:ABC-2 type transport system ATP-binding protein